MSTTTNADFSQLKRRLPWNSCTLSLRTSTFLYLFGDDGVTAHLGSGWQINWHQRRVRYLGKQIWPIFLFYPTEARQQLAEPRQASTQRNRPEVLVPEPQAEPLCTRDAWPTAKAPSWLSRRASASVANQYISCLGRYPHDCTFPACLVRLTCSTGTVEMRQKPLRRPVNGLTLSHSQHRSGFQ
jgi:hypothetical protein